MVPHGTTQFDGQIIPLNPLVNHHSPGESPHEMAIAGGIPHFQSFSDKPIHLKSRFCFVYFLNPFKSQWISHEIPLNPIKPHETPWNPHFSQLFFMARWSPSPGSQVLTDHWAQGRREAREAAEPYQRAMGIALEKAMDHSIHGKSVENHGKLIINSH